MKTFGLYMCFFTALNACGQQLSNPCKYDFTIKVNDSLAVQMDSNDSLFHFTNNQSFTPSIKVNMGTLNSDKNRDFDFYITNHSDSSIYIGDTYWIEPQFEPKLDRSKVKIKKGETFKFTWKYHSLNRPGSFTKSGQFSLSPVRINISFNGYCLPRNIVMSSYQDFKNSLLNENVFSEFKIYNKTVLDDRSYSSILKVDSVTASENTTVEYDNVTNTISQETSKSFKVIYSPKKLGKSTAYVFIYINGEKIQYRLFTNIKNRTKKKTYR